MLKLHSTIKSFFLKPGTLEIVPLSSVSDCRLDRNEIEDKSKNSSCTELHKDHL